MSIYAVILNQANWTTINGESGWYGKESLCGIYECFKCASEVASQISNNCSNIDTKVVFIFNINDQNPDWHTKHPDAVYFKGNYLHNFKLVLKGGWVDWSYEEKKPLRCIQHSIKTEKPSLYFIISSEPKTPKMVYTKEKVIGIFESRETAEQEFKNKRITTNNINLFKTDQLVAKYKKLLS